jgi:hypothetical protein
MKHASTLRFALIPACAFLAAACVTTTTHTYQQPINNSKPDSAPPQPPPPPSPPPPALLPAQVFLSPEQRQQAQAQAAQALEQALAPARGSSDKLRRLLGLSDHPATRIERYMADESIAAFNDPAFVPVLVPALSDAQLAEIQDQPAQAAAIAGRGVGTDLGFDRVDLAAQKILLRVIGDTYAVATPQECQAMSPGASPGADSGTTLYTVMDRLPADEERAFAHVVVSSMRLPPRPVAPLTYEEREQFKTAIQRYFNSQPQEVRDRYLQFYFSKSSPDTCWVIAQTAMAIVSGDDDTAALGLRAFAGSIAPKAGGS